MSIKAPKAINTMPKTIPVPRFVKFDMRKAADKMLKIPMGKRSPLFFLPSARYSWSNPKAGAKM